MKTQRKQCKAKELKESRQWIITHLLTKMKKLSVQKISGNKQAEHMVSLTQKKNLLFLVHKNSYHICDGKALMELISEIIRSPQTEIN